MQRKHWQRRQLVTSERRDQLAPDTTQHSGRHLRQRTHGEVAKHQRVRNRLEEVASKSSLTLVLKCREYLILSALFAELIASPTLSLSLTLTQSHGAL